MDKIAEQKVALFDILRQIERTQNGLNQLVAIKNDMLKQLEALEAQPQTEEQID